MARGNTQEVKGAIARVRGLIDEDELVVIGERKIRDDPTTRVVERRERWKEVEKLRAPKSDGGGGSSSPQRDERDPGDRSRPVEPRQPSRSGSDSGSRGDRKRTRDESRERAPGARSRWNNAANFSVPSGMVDRPKSSTGASSFHFKHTYVSKRAAPTVGGKPVDGSGRPISAHAPAPGEMHASYIERDGAAEETGRAQAAYIERDGAIERLLNGAHGAYDLRDNDVGRDNGFGREPGHIDEIAEDEVARDARGQPIVVSNIEVYDARRYKEMGIDRTPTEHLGTRAAALEAVGVVTPVGARNARKIWDDAERQLEREAEIERARHKARLDELSAASARAMRHVPDHRDAHSLRDFVTGYRNQSNDLADARLELRRFELVTRKARSRALRTRQTCAAHLADIDRGRAPKTLVRERPLIARCDAAAAAHLERIDQMVSVEQPTVDALRALVERKSKVLADIDDVLLDVLRRVETVVGYAIAIAADKAAPTMVATPAMAADTARTPDARADDPPSSRHQKRRALHQRPPTRHRRLARASSTRRQQRPVAIPSRSLPRPPRRSPLRLRRRPKRPSWFRKRPSISADARCRSAS